MKLFIYGKTTCDMNVFENVLKYFDLEKCEVFITIENKRSFREWNQLKLNMSKEDICIISSIKDIGLSDIDIAKELDWFIENDFLLAVSEISATYEYGISQPMNKAILSAMFQVYDDKKILKISKKSCSGRPKVEFPDGWDELYDKWERRKISSKQFLEASGLKKATFYNLISEYKMLKKYNEDYRKKYIG